MTRKELIYGDECYKIVGLCMNVHSRLGRGFREVVYKDALEIEIKKQQIPFEREKSFTIEYEKIILPHKFVVDYLLFNSIVLEIKAANLVNYDAFRQTLNYLKASKIRLGLLVNFGLNSLSYRRIVN